MKKISATIADNLSQNRSFYLQNKNLEPYYYAKRSNQLRDPVPLTQYVVSLYGVFTRIPE
jgi:hypothetical protein